MPPYEIVTADVLEWAASYTGPLFHSLLCDPPYHLTTITKRFGKEGAAPATGGVYERSSRGFMGQTWDGGDIAFRPETWAAFMPLLHPGAFCMAFASARGWHRMVLAIEDAGFLIHPSIFVWLYGSGFPKATRIDTQIDARGGESTASVDFMAAVLARAQDKGVSRAQLTALFPSKSGGKTGWLYNKVSGHQSLTPEQFNALKALLDLPYDDLVAAERDVVGTGKSGLGTGPTFAFLQKQDKPDAYNLTEPATELAKAWEGHRYGSQAIKPAAEPIIVFQKPYAGRPIDDITRSGAGALNVDAGRIGVAEADRLNKGGSYSGNRTSSNVASMFNAGKGNIEYGTPPGRWPANFALSHAPECRKIGVRVVQGSRIDKPFEGQVKAFADGGLGGPRPARGIGDADGMETVDVWECVDECPVWRLNAQVGKRTSGGGPVFRKQDGGYNKDWPMGMQASIYGDSGPVSRFFHNADWSEEVKQRLVTTDPVRYEEKASRSEREEGLRFVLPCVKCGSIESETHLATVEGKEIEVACRRDAHPTVKPIGLARWLATLLLPPDRYAPRRLLVPFAGVGSEIIGAKQAGWEEVVGVELHEEYVSVAVPRLSAHIGMF